MFITFEGTEGCGKSTQIDLFATYLSDLKIPFLLTREPGGTVIGKKIREILLDPENDAITSTAELLLYAADRAQHVEEVIAPALKKGTTVVCDRFSDATIAYQGYGRGLDMETIKSLNVLGRGKTIPDLTFLIDCPVEVGIKRAFKRSDEEGTKEMRFEMEDLSFHEKVRNGYLAIAETEPERVKIVDGNRNVEEVKKEIIAIFEEKELSIETLQKGGEK